MLYFFYGSADGRREKIEEWKENLFKKEKGASVRPLLEEEWNSVALEELAAGQGLFGGTYVFSLKDFLLTKEDKEFFAGTIKTFASSHNIFLVSEPSATKELLRTIEKAGGEVFSVGTIEKAAKRDTSGFAMADAAAKRDRKLAWALFHEAASRGAAAEELHGILFWQMKNLALAKHGAPPKFSYPLMKARSVAPKWGEGEIRGALSRLVSIYHEAHRGKYELPVALELFLLETV